MADELEAMKPWGLDSRLRCTKVASLRSQLCLPIQFRETWNHWTQIHVPMVPCGLARGFPTQFG